MEEVIHMKKPVIGITAVKSADKSNYEQRAAYAQAVWNADGEAILLPCNQDKSNCGQIVDLLDGLLVPGGADIDPMLYGEEKTEACGTTCLWEDEYDLELIKEAVKQKKPVLAICRGMQAVNVLFGGTLYQDIPTFYSTEIAHLQDNKMSENCHTVMLKKDSYLAKILGQTEDVKVNTFHHQAVKKLAKDFSVVAKAPDGTIEAIENEDASVVCVQWHPERMQELEMYRNLFKDFVFRCRKCHE